MVLEKLFGKIDLKDSDNLRNRIICGALLTVYAVLTFVGAMNHELWFDEAQAWVIARDNTIAGIFNQISYEGHPPLWYLIMYVFSHMGFECTVIPYISWFITLVSAVIIMYKAPFNTFVKTVVIFSGGFLYFNSVISRIYCVINFVVALIAWLYPARKEHPLLWGALLAVLANTHVCMSGFVGIAGLIMLSDVFGGLKTSTFRRNAAGMAGLMTAGAGVAIMVVPLLNSLSMNSITSEYEYTVFSVIGSVAGSFANVLTILIDKETNDLLVYIVAGILSVFLFGAVILMRHKRRPFLMLVFFCICYVITTEVFWSTIKNRAHIFALMFFITAWIAEYEPLNKSSGKFFKAEFRTDTRFVRALLDFVRKADENFRNSFIRIITVILLASIPSGVYYLLNDYVKPFAPHKMLAEYVRDNLPEDSVLVTVGESATAVSAYNAQCRLYSLNWGEFYTYNTHKRMPEEIPRDKIYSDLEGCDNVYFLYADLKADARPSGRNVIHYIRSGMTYGLNICYYEITGLDLEKEIEEAVRLRLVEERRKRK